MVTGQNNYLPGPGHKNKFTGIMQKQFTVSSNTISQSLRTSATPKSDILSVPSVARSKFPGLICNKWLRINIQLFFFVTCMQHDEYIHVQLFKI